MDSLFDKLLSKVMTYGNNYILSKLLLDVPLCTDEMYPITQTVNSSYIGII